MKRKLIPLAKRVLREPPHIIDLVDAIGLDELVAGRRIRVGGVPITNAQALVDAHAPLEIVELRDPSMLRGAIKLRHALDAFGVDVNERVCLDVGASTGGFTSELLRRGARRVYAVDAGAGQLLDVLRRDARVVNLERTNLAQLVGSTPAPTSRPRAGTEARRSPSARGLGLVPEAIDVVTMDLSYVSLANAVPQIGGVRLAPGADLVLLVKPMFELALSSPPPEEDVTAHNEAILRACIAVEASGARVVATMRSRVTGARGAIEHFIHAKNL